MRSTSNIVGVSHEPLELKAHDEMTSEAAGPAAAKLSAPVQVWRNWVAPLASSPVYNSFILFVKWN